jgi:hypothetical protein
MFIAMRMPYRAARTIESRVTSSFCCRAEHRVHTFGHETIIASLAENHTATIFATDTIFVALMCAPLAASSLDIVIQRVGNKLFFDKRDGSQLVFFVVNETLRSHSLRPRKTSTLHTPLQLGHLHQLELLAAGTATQW